MRSGGHRIMSGHLEKIELVNVQIEVEKIYYENLMSCSF